MPTWQDGTSCTRFSRSCFISRLRRLRVRPQELYAYFIANVRRLMPTHSLPNKTRREAWDPVEGKISKDNLLLLVECCGKICPKGRNWRKANILRSYYPRPVSSETLHLEFGIFAKGWPTNFEKINRELRDGFARGESLFDARCSLEMEGTSFGP